MPEVLEDLAVPQRIDAKDPEALHVLEEVPVEVPNLSQQGHLLEEEVVALHLDKQVLEDSDKHYAYQEAF